MGSNSNNPNAYDELKFTLIDKVKKYPAIWDKNHEQHHNRYILHQHWKRIAADMGIKGMNEEKIKKVWRNLRQEFGKQARRILRAGTETLDSASPTWPFFAPLLFLKEQFNPSAEGSGNTPTDPDMDETFDEFGEEFEFEHPEMSPPSPARSRSPSELSGSPAMNMNGGQFHGQQGYNSGSSRKRRHSGSEDTRVAVLQQRQRQQQQQLKYEEARLGQRQQQPRYRDEDDSRDEDVGFFNSLLPHVRQLHPQQKMMFRLRVQQQLYELIYGPYDPHQRLAYANSSSQGEPLCTAVYGNSQ